MDDILSQEEIDALLDIDNDKVDEESKLLDRAMKIMENGSIGGSISDPKLFIPLNEANRLLDIIKSLKESKKSHHSQEEILRNIIATLRNIYEAMKGSLDHIQTKCDECYKKDHVSKELEDIRYQMINIIDVIDDIETLLKK